MISRRKEHCCGNCGYVERENPRQKMSPMYCTNCNSEHCSEWVKEEDLCPLWVRWSDTTKYYNIATDHGHC